MIVLLCLGHRSLLVGHPWAWCPPPIQAAMVWGMDGFRNVVGNLALRGSSWQRPWAGPGGQEEA